MNKNIKQIGALIAIGLGAFPLLADAGIKCWTNREGVRECGNAVPPEYAQQETRTLNEQGLTVDVQKRAKTRDELAEEEHRQREEAARLAEQKRRVEAQAAYDRVLRSTFNSEQEITESRDRKIAAVEGTIELTRVTIGKMEAKLETFRKRAADLERAGKPVPDDLREDMDGLHRQIDEKNAYIAAKRREQDQLRTEYEGYLQRFRELN